MRHEDIKSFIEDATKGGWKGGGSQLYEVSDLGFIQFRECLETENKAFADALSVTVALLAPSAWCAVGEARGWEKGFYKDMMRAFVCLLIDGGSIDSALETLRPLRSSDPLELRRKPITYDS